MLSFRATPLRLPQARGVALSASAKFAPGVQGLATVFDLLASLGPRRRKERALIEAQAEECRV